MSTPPRPLAHAKANLAMLTLAQAMQRANAAYERGAWSEAEILCRRVLAARADVVDALNLLGIITAQTRRMQEAAELLGRAVVANPTNAAAHNNYANALHQLGRHDAALASYERVLELKPDYAEAHNNRGAALQELKRLDEALESYGRALGLKPDFEWVQGAWLHVKMKLCAWSEAEAQVAALQARIEKGERASVPFPLVALTGALSVQRKAAEIWASAKHPGGRALPGLAKRARRGKLRLGYYSADFHEHATTYLMAELFERHDRDRFELLAFSFGPDRRDGMRQRVAAAVDQFIDVGNRSDQEVALQSRALGIDIAVDLKGLTQDSRPGIFALRAAPLQVNYLGYPGTMGVDYIDYLIADATLIPAASRPHYAEKIAYLPDSYQVNDRQRAIAEPTPAREALGLPPSGFVFCCFNASYKITPATFDGWMRLLRQVEGSVLWLLEDNATAARNLRQEAEARGVGGERLIFAPPLPLPAHLARQRAADLFLDTLPCNAHTTASDALWAGLPVLTCLGESFAGRVAASLLNAIELPELVTTSQEQYEALAIALATDAPRLAQLKAKLARNRLTTPLFDTPRFTRHLEAAYTQMYERYQAGLPPDHLHVRS
jgi:predicted O-linked N-acetylglucosamine transferase (SPINDLY family)